MDSTSVARVAGQSNTSDRATRGSSIARGAAGVVGSVGVFEQVPDIDRSSVDGARRAHAANGEQTT